MSGERLPGWVPAATDPTEADAEALLGGDPALAARVAAASEPLDDEVEAVIRRAAPSPVPARRVPRIAWAVAVAAVAVAVSWAARPDPGEAPHWPWVPAFSLPNRGPLPPTASFARGSSAKAAHDPTGGRAPAPAPVAHAPPLPTAAPSPEATFRASGPVEVARGPSGTVVTQAGGVVRYDVDPVPTGQTFRVVARDVVVEVVGTSFDVGVEGRSVWVVVGHGRVRVRHGGREVVLDPGQRFDTGPRAAAPAPAAPALPVAPPAPPTPAGAQQRFAGLLDRVDTGERSTALLAELRALAADLGAGPLAVEAQIAALEVAVDVESTTDALAAVDAWLAAHPAHPRQGHVERLRTRILDERNP